MKIERSIKNAGTLLSGNVIAQGIAFLSYLLLSRLFTPDDFGLFTVFYGYLEVLIILSTCKYEQAIIVAPDDARAVQVSRMTLRLNLIVSLLFLALAALLAASSALSSQSPTGFAPLPLSQGGVPAGGGGSTFSHSHIFTFSTLFLLIPLMVYFSGTSRVYSALGVRSGRFRAIAESDVAGSLSGTVFKLLAGLLAPVVRCLHTFGLPLGTLLGIMVRNTWLRRRAAPLLERKPKRKPRQPLSPLQKGESPQGDGVFNSQFSTFLATARQYKHYPLYVMPKEFLSSFSANLPFLWLALYFDNATIGLFSLALTFLQRPVLMVANAMESSFYSDSASRQRQHQPLQRRLFRMTGGLAAVAIPLAAVGFFWAEPIFTFLLGDQWVGTGFYVRCLLPWMVVRLLANTLSFTANLFETQRVDFWLQVAMLLLRVAALARGIVQHDFRLAILLFCAASTLVQLVQLLWYLYQLQRYERLLKNDNPSA